MPKCTISTGECGVDMVVLLRLLTSRQLQPSWYAMIPPALASADSPCKGIHEEMLVRIVPVEMDRWG